MRHLVLFLVLGSFLFFSKRALESERTERPALVVRVASTASAEDTETAIDEAVLIEHALASKTVLTDPVVRDQLLRSMRTDAARGSEEATLLARALSLGVHRVDPLVRQRLIFQARQVLRASLTPEPQTDAALEAYLQAHRERYELPARVSFRQVFLSRTRHGALLLRDARALAIRLKDLGTSDDLDALSDPSLLPSSMTEASEREIAARFGPNFARAVFAARLGGFEGPAESSYGLHFVRVEERLPPSLPPLKEVQERVRTDHQHDAEEQALSKAVRELRQHYQIQVQERPR